MDLMAFVSGSMPITVNALAMRDPAGHDDTVTINVGFANGSIGTLAYFANGAKKLPKEYLEIYQGGQAAVIRDFRELSLFAGGRETKTRLTSQDKGQKTMVQTFLDNLRKGGAPVIPFAEQYAVTAATFAVLRSLRTGATEQVTVTGERPVPGGDE
jgi:predicted dehydrogenase